MGRGGVRAGTSVYGVRILYMQYVRGMQDQFKTILQDVKLSTDVRK